MLKQPEQETEHQLEARVLARLFAEQQANHEIGKRVFERRDSNRLSYPRKTSGRARWFR